MPKYHFMEPLWCVNYLLHYISRCEYTYLKKNYKHNYFAKNQDIKLLFFNQQYLLCF